MWAGFEHWEVICAFYELVSYSAGSKASIKLNVWKKLKAWKILIANSRLSMHLLLLFLISALLALNSLAWEYIELGSFDANGKLTYCLWKGAEQLLKNYWTAIFFKYKPIRVFFMSYILGSPYPLPLT